MAFPSIRSTINTNGTATSATPSVNLPATIKAGDTILVVFKSAAAGAIGWPDASWQELVDASPDASVGQIGIAYKKADGTEGSTISLTSGNGKFAAIAIAVQDATDPLIRAPEISTVAVGTTGEPNATTVTPTGGAKDYLWYTFFLMEGEQTGITSYPANFTLNQTGLANSGTGGAVTTNCTIAGAGRQQNAASQDAGVWDVTGTLDDSSAYTVAFHPAETIAAPLATGDHGVQEEIPIYNQKKAALRSVLTVVAVGLLQTTLFTAPASEETANYTQQTTLLIAPRSIPPWIPPNLLLQSLARPFTQTEWPLATGKPHPIQLRTWADGQRRILDSQDQFFAAAGQAPVYHWTVPEGKPRAPGLSNVVTQALQEVAPQPFAQNDWPLPRRGGTLLVTVSSRPSEEPAAGTPSIPVDWPLPQVKPRLGVLRTWTDGRELFLADQQPASLADWPVPLRGRELRLTWALGLQETTLAPQVDAPTKQTDWPLPQARPALRALQSWMDTRERVFEYPPPSNHDWPVPQRKPSLATLRTWACYYVIDETFPFVQQAQPKPELGKPYPMVLRTWSQNLLESTLFVAPVVPNNLLDWPLPQSKAALRQLLTWADQRELLLSDLVPAHQTEWPNPLARPALRNLRTWTQNLLPFPLTTPIVYPAGNLLDWPVPQTKPVLRALRTWTDTREILLTDQVPAHLTEWPNPRVPGVLRDLWTWTQNLQQTTLAPAPKPFLLTDWPNPLGKAFPPALRTWLQEYEHQLRDTLFGGAGQPLSNYDWPLFYRFDPLPPQHTQGVPFETLVTVTPVRIRLVGVHGERLVLNAVHAGNIQIVSVHPERIEIVGALGGDEE